MKTKGKKECECMCHKPEIRGGLKLRCEKCGAVYHGDNNGFTHIAPAVPKGKKEKIVVFKYCNCAWQPNETSPTWLGKEIPKYCANCLRPYFYVRFDKE